MKEDKKIRRPRALTGVTDAAARRMYDEAMAELEVRGQANPATSAQLACAAQWMQEARIAQRQIARLRRAEDEDGKAAMRIRALMRNKAMAEGEQRKIFDDLLLTPQRPRGRPPREEAAPEDEEDGGWDAFDDGAGAEGP
ncbi:MAG: hypothetical protein Q4F18_11020 [Clostridia bacterium]|nr:hypothetical protein [Clostridia bacterium]